MPVIGEIMIFTGNFVPVGWLPCQGQTLPIRPYTALFAVIGTTYGGDGKSNFMLPDLTGAVPMGIGENQLNGVIQQGTTKRIATHGTSTVRAFGLTYCIAHDGDYPERP
jgi:microcystin-dependent protein